MSFVLYIWQYGSWQEYWTTFVSAARRNETRRRLQRDGIATAAARTGWQQDENALVVHPCEFSWDGFEPLPAKCNRICDPHKTFCPRHLALVTALGLKKVIELEIQECAERLAEELGDGTEQAA